MKLKMWYLSNFHRLHTNSENLDIQIKLIIWSKIVSSHWELRTYVLRLTVQTTCKQHTLGCRPVVTSRVCSFCTFLYHDKPCSQTEQVLCLKYVILRLVSTYKIRHVQTGENQGVHHFLSSGQVFIKHLPQQSYTMFVLFLPRIGKTLLFAQPYTFERVDHSFTLCCSIYFLSRAIDYWYLCYYIY